MFVTAKRHVQEQQFVQGNAQATIVQVCCGCSKPSVELICVTFHSQQHSRCTKQKQQSLSRPQPTVTRLLHAPQPSVARDVVSAGRGRAVAETDPSFMVCTCPCTTALKVHSSKLTSTPAWYAFHALSSQGNIGSNSRLPQCNEAVQQKALQAQQQQELCCGAVYACPSCNDGTAVQKSRYSRCTSSD